MALYGVITGDTVFEDVALRAIHALWERRSTIGLVRESYSGHLSIMDTLG